MRVQNAKQHPLGMLFWGERGVVLSLSQSLLHDLTHLVKVVVCGLCRHQIFGAAVLTLKHGVDHAEFAQLIEFAVNGGW